MGIGRKISIVLTVVFLLMADLLSSNDRLQPAGQKIEIEKEAERRSITFIMGEDRIGSHYFEMAEKHFLFSESEKTDVLIKSCRSFEDLIHYLNQNKEPVPWSAIQVVLHGNPYSGLSLPIINEGPRATPKNLVKALMDDSLPRLQTCAIDSTTQINFWACGIGENPFIKIAMDHFFKLPDGNVPPIYIAPHFVVFKNVRNSAVPKKLKASYWPYIYKRGYRPANWKIIKALKTQFPDAEIDWADAITKNAPEGEQSEFQNSFHIPVSWTVIYPTKKSRPAIATEKEKMQWIESQEALMSQIEECNIPIGKFTWTVNKIIHTNGDGVKVPAIKAIGMATVLCVLKTEIEH